MAKITVVGDVTVITSSIKMETLKMVEQYRPEALTLVEEDKLGKMKEVFRICTTEHPALPGSISGVGAVFNNTTRDEEGYATLTISSIGCGTSEEIKDAILLTLSRPIAKLNRLELQIASEVSDIEAEKHNLEDSITII